MKSVSWKRVSLAELCSNPDDIRCGPFGTQLNKSEFRDEGIPLWGIKQVNVQFSIPTKEFLDTSTATRLKQYDLRPGDLVMTRKGTVGNCATYPSNFPLGVMHSDLLRIRVDGTRCDSGFLVYQLHHSQDVARQLALISGGAIMPGINVGRLKMLEVIAPPLAEQKRIAGILDAADALRAKRRAALAQLDALAQSLFLDLFGDPVTNPRGWEVVKFSQIGKTRLGKMLDKGKRTGNHLHPYLANTNVKWGRFDLTDLREMDFNEADRIEFSLRRGDLLICEGGEVGRCAIWKDDLEDCYFQKAIHRCRVAEDKAVPEYLMYYLWFMAERGGFKDFVSTSTIAHLTGEKLRNLPVPLPPLPLQQSFAAAVESIEKQKARHREQLAGLDALFASLQHRAFRGEL
jgi:type I restriction enzyme S subunit